MAAHFENGHRRGKRGGEDEPPAHGRGLGGAALEGVGRGAPVVPQARLIARMADCLGQSGGIDDAFQPIDRGGFGRQIDPRRSHACDPLQGLFDMGDTGGAGHAADAHRDMGEARLVARLLHPRGKIGRIGPRPELSGQRARRPD